ncbi:hypothetical protein M758_12G166000 [Ceratodon purpureus]|uniref:Uncharacterized protein n=1 Tax=Ceratodon purpureus TaxID=3225 RepID=A0A8T0G7P7_CERPU|nr:hypothetical protein KC19_12G163500 [Ceratodon purpureus]KAG0599617.1 hypothetical protein M758_12G166000 [Ceratodon purpureus]
MCVYVCVCVVWVMVMWVGFSSVEFRSWLCGRGMFRCSCYVWSDGVRMLVGMAMAWCLTKSCCAARTSSLVTGAMVSLCGLYLQCGSVCVSLLCFGFRRTGAMLHVVRDMSQFMIVLNIFLSLCVCVL